MIARALAPFGAVTAALTARRVARPGFEAGVAVFCAGNPGVGGSGKTILARHLLALLAAQGKNPFALTRGYGGRLSGPLRIDPARHGAAAVGDEALLLAASAPAILAHDRAAGARLAVSLGAGAIVMDDGLQNPALRKTASFLVIDGPAGFGNGFLLPAGPLREPAAAAAARCVAAVLIGEDRTGVVALLPPGLAILRAALVPRGTQDISGKRVLAFAGIGRPAKFFETIVTLGANLVGAREFPDHHAYTKNDEARLGTEAAGLDAILVCTEKDFVKLSAALRACVVVIRVGLAFEDEAALARFVE